MQPRSSVLAKSSLMLAAICLVGGCSGNDLQVTDPFYEPVDEGASDRVLIQMKDNLPQPTHIEIEYGKVVEWRNVGVNDHSVSTYGTPDEWEDTLLKPGQRFVHTFSAPGEYAYICIVHGEIGDVIVSDPTY